MTTRRPSSTSGGRSSTGKAGTGVWWAAGGAREEGFCGLEPPGGCAGGFAGFAGGSSLAEPRACNEG